MLHVTGARVKHRRGHKQVPGVLSEGSSFAQTKSERPSALVGLQVLANHERKYLQANSRYSEELPFHLGK
jgi:hypothetical protein